MPIFVDEERGVGAGRYRDGFPAQIVRVLDLIIGAGNPFELRHEESIGKSDLGLSTGHVGGRAAFDVDRPVGDEREAGRRCDRIVFDGEIGQAQLRLHRVHDVLAQFNGEPDWLQVVVQV